MGSVTKNVPGNPHHLLNWIRTGYRYSPLLNRWKPFTERHAFNRMPRKSKVFSTQLVILCEWRNNWSFYPMLANCFPIPLFAPSLGYLHIKRIFNVSINTYETIISQQHDTPIWVFFLFVFLFLTKWVLVSLFYFWNIKRFINTVLVKA